MTHLHWSSEETMSAPIAAIVLARRTLRRERTGGKGESFGWAYLDYLQERDDGN